MKENYYEQYVKKNKKTICTSILNEFKGRMSKCKNFKLIPRETFQKMTEEEYQNGEIFLCNKCNIKMNPVFVEVE